MSIIRDQNMPVQSLYLDGPGSIDRPIGILDDEEQDCQFNRLLQRSRNEELLKQALLCRTSIDVTFAVIKTRFRGTLKQKEDALKKEIQLYFFQKMGINLETAHFKSKIQPPCPDNGQKLTGIALMVYGVDFMNTRQIGSMFTVPGYDAKSFIQKIIWVDDSSCKVVFFSPQNAQMALQHLILDPNQYKHKAEEESSLHIPKDWFQLKPYQIYGIPRKLEARHITLQELEAPKKDTFSLYVAFQNAEKGLELHLLTKYQAFDKYTQITNQIEFENYRKDVFKPNRYNPKNKLSRELTDTKRFNDYVFMRPQPTTQRQGGSDRDRGLLDVSFVENGAKDMQAEAQKQQNMTGNILSEIQIQPQNSQRMVAQEERPKESKRGVVMIEEQDQSFVEEEKKEEKKPVAASVPQTVVNVQVQPQAEVPQQAQTTQKSDNAKITLSSQQVTVTVTEQPKAAPVVSKPVQEAPKPVQEALKPVQEAPKPVQQAPKPVESKPVVQSKPNPPPAQKPAPVPSKAKPSTSRANDHYEPDSY